MVSETFAVARPFELIGAVESRVAQWRALNKIFRFGFMKDSNVSSLFSSLSESFHIFLSSRVLIQCWPNFLSVDVVSIPQLLEDE